MIETTVGTPAMIENLMHADAQVREATLKQLYLVYYPVFEKYVLSRGGILEDAKDIFQDGMIVLYRQNTSE